MTMAATTAMTMTMLAAQAAVLDVAHLPTRANHKEATKHHLQVVQRRAKGNVLLHRRSHQKKWGQTQEHHPGELGSVQHSKQVSVLNDVRKVYMLMATKHSQ
jgi:hypothetical protein